MTPRWFKLSTARPWNHPVRWLDLPCKSCASSHGPPTNRPWAETGIATSQMMILVEISWKNDEKWVVLWWFYGGSMVVLWFKLNKGPGMTRIWLGNIGDMEFNGRNGSTIGRLEVMGGLEVRWDTGPWWLQVFHMVHPWTDEGNWLIIIPRGSMYGIFTYIGIILNYFRGQCR